MSDRERVFTLEEIRAQPTWPALAAFVAHAARQNNEGPVMAAWTTIVYGKPHDVAYWRRAVPAALADHMMSGHVVTPAAWQGLAWMLSLSVHDLKEQVSFALMPDPTLR